ncbi:MAG: hypothetical protein R6V58_15195 [Planctomycetota bacterium]
MAQIRTVEGGMALENDDILLTFPLTHGQISEYRVFGRRAGGQSHVATVDPLAEVVYRTSDGGRASEQIVADGYQMDQRGGDSVLRLEAEFYDADGGRWSFSIEFYLRATGPRVTVSSRLAVTRPRQLLAFRSPFLRTLAGDDGRRPAALLPGIDWPVGDERSSAPGPAPPPFQKRHAPHPYKITVPVMAVVRQGFVIGLTWDPLQIWDGERVESAAHRYPTAAFASPNFIEEEDDSDLMGLFLPSIPKFVDENELAAARPCQVTPGRELQIECSLFVLASNNVLDGLHEHLQLNGLVPPPPKPRDYKKNLELDVETYLKRAWSEKHSGWTRSTSPQQRWTFYSELVALALWRASLFAKDPDLKRRARDCVETAVSAHGGTAGLSMAYFRGGFAEELPLEKGQLDKLETSQHADGGWTADDDESGRKPKKSHMGVTAQRAARLLRSGLLTGDRRHLDAGTKAIRLLDRFDRPCALRVWDVDAATPDLYVAAHLVSAYLDQYLITGSPGRLERAVYWAWAGLPFVYLWHAHDRRIMRYATVPLFGVTSMDRKPRFGIAAQWTGLVYANQLLRLSRYDRSMRWHRIGRAITLCGMQLQKTGPDVQAALVGFYPDAFNVVDGRDYYPLCLNPQYITRNVLHLLGEHVEPNCEVVPWRERRARIASVAHMLAIRSSPRQIAVRLAYHAGETCYVTLADCGRPTHVRLNDRDLERIDDLADMHRAWLYNRERGLTIVRLLFDEREATLEFRF